MATIAWPMTGLPWWKVFRRCASIAAASSLWFIAARIERRPLRSYGFGNWTLGRPQLFLGVGLGLGSLAALLGIGFMTGGYRVALAEDQANALGKVLGLIPASLLVGALEELIFRGFILQQLMACSRPFAVVGSSLAYALVHLKTRVLGVSVGLELTGLFLLGVLLALSYVRTKQLYLAVGLHAVLAYGALVNKALIEFPHPSLSWLIGTNRLVNGVFSWIVLVAAGGVMWWFTRASNARRGMP